MLKNLFSILLILASLSISAHTCTPEVLHSDLEYVSNFDASSDISVVDSTHHSYFDIQTENYSVVFFSDTEPSRVDRILKTSKGLINRSKQLCKLQNASFNRAELHAFNIFHLRETLFPFHSFW